MENLNFEQMVDALKSEDSEIRANAAHNLGRLGDIRAAEPLIDALDDNDGRVRFKVIEALSFYSESKVIPAMITALNTENNVISLEAAEALIDIGEPATPYLIEALDNPDVNVRRWAASILGFIGDSRAITSLTNLIDDPYKRVRDFVEVAIKRN